MILGSPLGTHARAVEALGGQVAGEGAQEVSWVLCTLSLDPRGLESAELLAAVTKCRPKVVAIDAPMDLNPAALTDALSRLKYTLVDFEILCTHYGDATARKRRVIVAGRGEAAASLASIRMPPARRTPQGVKAHLQALDDGGPHTWVDSEGRNVVWDPRVNNNGDSMMPKGAGHITIDGHRYLIYSADGPVGTIRWPGKGICGPGACLLHVP